MKIVLINGKKRSGKDFFARQLSGELSKLGYSSKIVSFADPIKGIIADTFNISLQDLDNFKNNSTPVGIIDYGYDEDTVQKLTDFRSILQNFGTEAMKKWFGEDVWVKVLLERTRDMNYDFILVPDFRFLCENLVGGITVKICNNDIEKNSTDEHRSENELNDFSFDHVFDNTGYRDITEDVREFAKLLGTGFLHQT